MTAKEKLRQAIERLSEEEARDALSLLERRQPGVSPSRFRRAATCAAWTRRFAVASSTLERLAAGSLGGDARRLRGSEPPPSVWMRSHPIAAQVANVNIDNV